MTYMVIAAAVLFFVGYLLVRAERDEVMRENTRLMTERDAYAEALNRNPYPPDVEPILQEFSGASQTR